MLTPNTFWDLDTKSLDRTINVNLKSYLWLTQMCQPYLEKSTVASIVNCASVCSFSGGYDSLAYYLTKAAVNQVFISDTFPFIPSLVGL